MNPTVRITNVECNQNLADIRDNLDIVSLRRPDDTHKNQQWIQFPKADDAICFKNVGSGAYLCEDTNPTNPGGVRADMIKQFKWKLHRVHNHWTIRPFYAAENSKNLKMERELKPVKLHNRLDNSKTYMWDITTIS